MSEIQYNCPEPKPSVERSSPEIVAGVEKALTSLRVESNYEEVFFKVPIFNEKNNKISLATGGREVSDTWLGNLLQKHHGDYKMVIQEVSQYSHALALARKNVSLERDIKIGSYIFSSAEAAGIIRICKSVIGKCRFDAAKNLWTDQQIEEIGTRLSSSREEIELRKKIAREQVGSWKLNASQLLHQVKEQAKNKSESMYYGFSDEQWSASAEHIFEETIEEATATNVQEIQELVQAKKENKVVKAIQGVGESLKEAWKDVPHKKVVAAGTLALAVIACAVALNFTSGFDTSVVQEETQLHPTPAASLSVPNEDSMYSHASQGDQIVLEKRDQETVDQKDDDKKRREQLAISVPKLAVADVEVAQRTLPTTSPELYSKKELMSIAEHAFEETGYANFLYPVSEDIRLPENFPLVGAEVEITKVDRESGTDGKGEGVEIAKLIEKPLADMLAEAKHAGFHPYVRSGFRSVGIQDWLYEKTVQKKMSEGMPRQEAEKWVDVSTSRGGYSEHHTGFAIDLMDKDLPGYVAEAGEEGWESARAHYDNGLFGWLRDNAHRYGFVISYPVGRNIYEAKAGSGRSGAEPWHLRYVGEKFAAQLYDEDYLDPANDVTLNSKLVEVQNTLGQDANASLITQQVTVESPQQIIDNSRELTGIPFEEQKELKSTVIGSVPKDKFVFTMDDGADMAALDDLINKYNIPVTLFLTDPPQNEQTRQQLKKWHDEKKIVIGYHTTNHLGDDWSTEGGWADGKRWSVNDIQADFEKWLEAYRQFLGPDFMPKHVRSPYGLSSNMSDTQQWWQLNKWALDHGMSNWFWNGGPWEFSQKPESAPLSIFLTHPREFDRDWLVNGGGDQLLARLKAEGKTAVTADDAFSSWSTQLASTDINTQQSN